MIINLQAFIAQERQVWSELERVVDRLEKDAGLRLEFSEIRQLHTLYQRTSADLARIKTFAAERELNRYLETLVARAYAEIHKSNTPAVRLHPLKWLLETLPQTFRRHVAAYWLALAITVGGALFGGAALLFDPAAKEIILPIQALQGSPTERVAREEKALDATNAGHQVSMSSFYLTHNTRVAILTLALGMSYGIGTLVELFFNGVILGAVFTDYIVAGQARFVFGWLMPHGVIEIPAILMAGQAGLILAGALVGWGGRLPLRKRLAAIGPDLVTLICGVALLLAWAGIIEAFLSQYHEPVLPYSIKIAFGCVELTLLVFYLACAGKPKQGREGAPARPPS